MAPSHDRYDFAFAPSYRLPALAFGVTRWTSWVRLDDELSVRFGPWSLRTPVSNIAGVEITGGFSWWRTAGPAHLSLADRGITFATNGTRAVCVSFREPVRALDPTGRLLRHPGATLTVGDVDGLYAELRQAIAEPPP